MALDDVDTSSAGNASAVISELRDYTDERSNEVRYAGPHAPQAVSIVFRGSGNRLTVEDDAAMSRVLVDFLGDNAEVFIGGDTSCGCRIRIGSNSRISIGRSLSATGPFYMTAFEGSSIQIGRDCMLSGNVQLRADDAHAIFDVETGQRTNRARPIIIGDHVWLGEGSVILGGTKIGDGSVVGMRSVVKCKAPNNCVIAGQPARVVRRNIAWERPYLGYEHLFDAGGNPNEITKEFWRPSSDQ